MKGRLYSLKDKYSEPVLEPLKEETENDAVEKLPTKKRKK